MNKWLRTTVFLLACATTVFLIAFISISSEKPEFSSDQERLVTAEVQRASPQDILSGVTTLGRGIIVLAGDSLAAGDGAGTYEPETREPEHACHRSSNGIMSTVVPDEQRKNVACSRATTTDFYGTASYLLPQAKEAPNQLTAIKRAQADTVLLLIGANDIGFPQLLDECLARDNFDCSKDPVISERTLDLTEKLQGKLERLYGELLDATSAQIIVPAYPNLLDGTGSCGRINAAERSYGSNVITGLNGVIADATRNVRRRHSDGQRLIYAPETARALSGHGPCSSDAWVNPYGVVSLLGAANSTARAQEILHPTATGYAAITRALMPHLQN